MNRALFRHLDDRLAAVPSGAMTLCCFGLVLAVGLVDHFTGSEVSFSIFYLAPIALAGRYGGKRAGVIISFAAAAMWLTADLTTGHVYSRSWIVIWNCLVRLGFFLIVTILLGLLKDRLAQQARMATTDGLTGLTNSHAFRAHLETELARAKRYRRPFSLAYIDLDNFKTVNDLEGHEAGDAVLRCVGETLSASTRRSDVAARLGGDEFAVLFVEAGYDAARQVVQKLSLQLLETMRQSRCPVTFSIGLITFVRPMDTTRETLAAVDNLMYTVKRAGKNNIAHQVWGEETEAIENEGLP